MLASPSPSMKIVSAFLVLPLPLVICLHLVTISTIFYWYMIEAGVSLIAACLPSLRFLFANKSLLSIVYSVRSAISLRSTPIRRNDYYTDVESNRSIRKAGRIYGHKDASTATNVVGGIDKDIELHPLPPADQIQVEHKLLQTHGNA